MILKFNSIFSFFQIWKLRNKRRKRTYSKACRRQNLVSHHQIWLTGSSTLRTRVLSILFLLSESQSSFITGAGPTVCSIISSPSQTTSLCSKGQQPLLLSLLDPFPVIETEDNPSHSKAESWPVHSGHRETQGYLSMPPRNQKLKEGCSLW